MRKKKSLVFLLILIFLFAVLSIFFVVQGRKLSFRPEYTLPLPDGYVLEVNHRTGNASIFFEGKVVGGILNCPYSKRVLGSENPAYIHSASFTMYYEIIMAALGAKNAPGVDSAAFDHSMQTSKCSDCSLWCGNGDQEYQHFLYLYNEGILSLWFDLTQVEESHTYDIVTHFVVEIRQW